MAVAFLLDYIFAEVKRFHPLVGFGFLTNNIEKVFNVNRSSFRPIVDVLQIVNTPECHYQSFG